MFLDIVTYQRGKVRKKEGNEEKSKSFDLFTLHSNSSFAVIYIYLQKGIISPIFISMMDDISIASVEEEGEERNDAWTNYDR